MRTVIIIAIGLLLWAVAFTAVRKLASGNAAAAANAAKMFIGVWLLVAAGNLWLGVARAGYSVQEELPIFLVIFLVPASAALLAWRRSR